MIDHTHAPDAASWVPDADNHPDFPVQNLPLGVFSLAEEPPRICTAIGDFIADLAALAGAGLLPGALARALTADRLNPLFALPAGERLGLRHALFEVFTETRHRAALLPHLHPASACALHLPFRIGDYTDFYTGIHHATNIGRLFRPDNPLLPNYKYVPIGYHGRASSVCVSGTQVIRPKGQIKPASADTPVYAPCRRLDYELELGLWIAGSNMLGQTVPIAKAWERIGGVCLLNDWSARDIQAWEYQPLGPFLAKSFLTTVSPWVVTTEALAPFRIAQPPRPKDDPAPLPYLLDGPDQATGALALTLEARLITARMRRSGMAPYCLSRGSAAETMYWTAAQMVTHHASNGCDLHPGDLLGTGTLSGPDEGSLGSLMEIARGGSAPISLPTGERRVFLEDGDELQLMARAERSGFRGIGFGRCTGVVGAAP